MITLSKNKQVLPGLVKLYAIPVFNVQNIIGNRVYVINPDYIYQFLVANDSLKATTKPVKSDRGKHYNISIQASMPGRSDYNDSVLDYIRNHKVALVYQESDGSFKRAGTKHTGFDFTYTYDTGGNDNFFQGYRLQFNAELKDRPLRSRNHLMHDEEEITL